MIEIIKFTVFILICLVMSDIFDPRAITNHEGEESEDELLRDQINERRVSQ